jgi:hypothetical protein
MRDIPNNLKVYDLPDLIKSSLTPNFVPKSDTGVLAEQAKVTKQSS